MKQTLSVIFTAVFLLAACAARMPLPQQTDPQAVKAGTYWFQLERWEGGAVAQASLLAVQSGSGGLRFVQTDALGAPVSRQRLTEKGWRNDGFIAPNAGSRRVFAAVLPLLAGNAAAVYADAEYRPSENGGVFERRGRELWRMRQEGGYHWITFPDGSRWRVKAIEENAL